MRRRDAVAVVLEPAPHLVPAALIGELEEIEHHGTQIGGRDLRGARLQRA